MAFRNIIVVGASAGGVEALGELASGLPKDLPAAVFVVLHVASKLRSVLPRILSEAGRLPALHAADGMGIEPGRIIVAPPDSHLIIEPGVVRLSRGPRENGARPAVDPLFRSAARAYGPRVVGVVLTGALDDGTAGLFAIKRVGGVSIVQRPDEASFPGMPSHALDAMAVDFVLPLDKIAARLATLSRSRVPRKRRVDQPVRRRLDDEIHAALRGAHWEVKHGEPSPFSCPACGGVLFEVREEAGLLRFRCHVGHAYGSQSLHNQKELALESALWAGLRALAEQGALSRKMEDRALRLGQQRAAHRFEERAVTAEEQAALLREVLLRELPAPPLDVVEAPPGKARKPRKAGRRSGTPK